MFKLKKVPRTFLDTDTLSFRVKIFPPLSIFGVIIPVGQNGDLATIGKALPTTFKNYARTRIPIYTCRPISTSDKNKDIASTANESLVEKSQELKDLEAHFGDADPTKLKNWESYGWDYYDRENDTFQMNIANFGMFSVGLLGLWLYAYLPDHSMREWAVREAFLEMERREKAGLPLVDPYLVPPDQIELPTEEEIGDQEIII